MQDRQIPYISKGETVQQVEPRSHAAIPLPPEKVSQLEEFKTWVKGHAFIWLIVAFILGWMANGVHDQVITAIRQFTN